MEVIHRHIQLNGRYQQFNNRYSCAFILISSNILLLFHLEYPPEWPSHGTMAWGWLFPGLLYISAVVLRSGWSMPGSRNSMLPETNPFKLSHVICVCAWRINHSVNFQCCVQGWWVWLEPSLPSNLSQIWRQSVITVPTTLTMGTPPGLASISLSACLVSNGWALLPYLPHWPWGHHPDWYQCHFQLV